MPALCIWEQVCYRWCKEHVCLQTDQVKRFKEFEKPKAVAFASTTTSSTHWNANSETGEPERRVGGQRLSLKNAFNSEAQSDSAMPPTTSGRW